MKDEENRKYALEVEKRERLEREIEEKDKEEFSINATTPGGLFVEGIKNVGIGATKILVGLL